MLAAAVSRLNSAAVGRMICIALLCASALPSLAAAQAPAIAPRITTTTITLPAALEGVTDNFCTWGGCTLGPRLYQAPMADGRTLIGWSDASCNGHVSRVNNGAIEQTFDFAATPVRGLVVHPDNSFAVLLLDFNNGNTDYYTHYMELSLLSATGSPMWTTELLNNAEVGATPGVVPAEEECGAFNPSNGQSWVGDSRLGYGGGQYGAYFAVHAEPDSGGIEHDGDQLTLVNDSGVIQNGGWQWGLSHSLAELIDYHPDLARLTAVGITDCYPPLPGWTGIPPPTPGLDADFSTLTDSANQLLAAAGNCGGSVSIQLGQMAAVTGGNWLVALNGQSEAAFTDAFGNPQPAWVGQGVGVVSFNGSYVATPVTWLSSTDPTGTDERDPVLARIGTSLSSNRFLVGWHLQTEGTFSMAVINPAAAILSPVEAVSPTAGWGNRDDSLKSRPDGSISWLQGAAGATTLQMYRYAEATPEQDFTGNRTSDLLWTSSTDMGIWIMSNGAFSSWADLGAPPAGWTIAGTGDFNGDGTADILWSNATTGDSIIWLMQNGAESTWADLGAPGTGWTVAGTGDFNGDGTTDILWRNTTSGDVAIWFIKNGAFSSWIDLGVPGAGWTIAGTGDFNGDGTTDILWSNTTTGDVGVWIMKGGAFSSWVDLGAPGAGWSIAGTGDFNGDGTTDILWINTVAADTGIWIMRNGAFSAWKDLGAPPVGWTVARTGDFNGDATTDILWRNTATGEGVIWLMQGGAFSSWVDLGVVPTTWSVVK
jgi:FG-GAP-like repeat